MTKLSWVCIVILLLAFGQWVDASLDYHFNETGLSFLDHELSPVHNKSMFVPLTLLHRAPSKGAVCLDGSLPGYHLDRGYGSGANRWLVNLEGGGWCHGVKSCVFRKTSSKGSSLFMEKEIPFTGILSSNAAQNPDFYNWNRVKIRYCDGASFAGDGEDNNAQLKFRGQRIWFAAMEELMLKGMRHANQAFLTGCSAGGLATIIHCDEFRSLFPMTTKVKCLSDAGLFLDAVDVSGNRTLRKIFRRVVELQGVEKNLPQTCTNNHIDPVWCFFPQNLIASVRTPLFILNTAYDSWQIQSSLAPKSADPHGHWDDCKLNYAKCTESQLHFLQGFRYQMLNAVKGFSRSNQNGLYINSCFSHCQSERPDTWFADHSPTVKNKEIAMAVGDWYFNRARVKNIDCPFPCDVTCHHLVFS